MVSPELPELHLNCHRATGYRLNLDTNEGTVLRIVLLIHVDRRRFNNEQCRNEQNNESGSLGIYVRTTLSRQPDFYTVTKIR